MTKIEWTDKTSNPIRVVKEDGSLGGHWCRKKDEGCTNCYAESINNNGYFSFASHLPYAGNSPELTLVENILESWERARKPQLVFVGDMTDLFGEWVSREWQTRIFDVAATSVLTFQFLTKRPEVMLEAVEEWLSKYGFSKLPENFWMGTTTATQKTADERIPILKKIPASVRFLSVEPQLEQIQFQSLDGIHWVICGGESGTNSRPCHVEWLRSDVEQCKKAKVPVYVKQYGSKPVEKRIPIKLNHPKGGNPNEWSEDLRVREFPVSYKQHDKKGEQKC